jgi:gluconolactonase
MKLTTLIAVVFGLAVSAFAQEADLKPSGDPSILPEGAKLEEIWNEGSFTEGVAAAPNGEMYFSDIPFVNDKTGRILKFDPKTEKVSVHSEDSGKSNGLFFDTKGRLIACCGAMGGKRAVVEVLPSGKLNVLVDSFEGKRLNSPNDLVVHQNGSIYFSDPRYAGEEPVELAEMSVYRIDLDGSVQQVTKSSAGRKNIEKPNGVHVSPDGKTLYVAENNNGSLDVRNQDPNTKKGRMTLNAFRIKRDKGLGKKTVLVDFGDQAGTDGMSIDTDGNIYAAARSEKRHGIIVYKPEGKELAYIPTKDLPTNCCFGRDKDAHTLYVTAGTGFYRIKLKSTGFHPVQNSGLKQGGNVR